MVSLVGILGALSAAQLGLLVYVYRRFDGNVPAGLSIGLQAVIVVVSGLALIPLVMVLGLHPLGTLPLGLTILSPPLLFGGMIASGGISEYVTALLYDSSILKPAPHQYGRARTLAVRGDVDGAVQEYLRYYREERDIPTALFGAAILLEQKQRPVEAADMYRTIMAAFPKNAPVWGEAALRLAAITEQQFRDRAGADKLRHEVVNRARGYPQSREAANQLLRRA